MEERAVVNALQFKEMTGTSLSQLEMRALEMQRSIFPKIDYSKLYRTSRY
jgi:hypothetical protein